MPETTARSALRKEMTPPPPRRRPGPAPRPGLTPFFRDPTSVTLSALLRKTVKMIPLRIERTH